ncbi:MAG: haloacid dehalogenase-like hydrolase, partial [Acidobacteriaceae bacterium]|nr:haloacid dehalogenase-like hydrolase [Acidobacteriaceae bacterium]
MSVAESLVLFDIDGTLLRGAGVHHKNALIEGIRQITGRETTLEGLTTSGMLDRDLIAHMLRASGESERKVRRTLREVMDACQGAYVANCSLDLSPFLCAGVADALAALKARGAVLGLVTGNLSAIGWRKMELAGLREYFSLGAFAEHGRTRARLALLAARQAKKEGLLRNGGRISLIGDHPNDVQAARVNGFQSVAVATGVMPFEELKAVQPDVL